MTIADTFGPDATVSEDVFTAVVDILETPPIKMNCTMCGLDIEDGDSYRLVSVPDGNRVLSYPIHAEHEV